MKWSGEVRNVISRMRPLMVGEVDTKVQAKIKTLRNAGTPVNVNIVLVTAEWIITAVDKSLEELLGWSIHGHNIDAQNEICEALRLYTD